MTTAKRKAMLEAGKSLFLSQGIMQTSMEEIAEAVPVSKMTVYNHFQSKEGLLDQVVNLMIAESWAQLQELLDEAKDPLEAFTRLYQEQERFSPAVSEPFVSDLAKFPEQMDKMLSFHQQKVLPELQLLIFKGQQKGQIRKDISPHILVAFLSFIKEYSARVPWYEGLGSPNAVGEQMMRILYYGFLEPDSRSSAASAAEPELNGTADDPDRDDSKEASAVKSPDDK
ncbi:TetR/AcrR family transcriptional regulator [Paenibacillus sp. JSM ZJ436]|uniref:TetR/AcrR family transcriptional regulator n=1 Tax=Paenibacillus sp. JSM ZJ436 TaxID=3376190 RepID=UPI0037B13817